MPAEIKNIVILIRLDGKIPFEKLSARWKKPKAKFPGRILMIQNTTFIAYSSGKVMSLGNKTVEQFHENAARLLNILKVEVGDYEISECDVQNIIATGTLGRTVNLYETRNEHRTLTKMEVELHPAIRFKIRNRSIMLHASGKYNILGCKSIDDVLLIDTEFLRLLN